MTLDVTHSLRLSGHPPSYGQIRSPCPALNSMANHGVSFPIPEDTLFLLTSSALKFIPRSGRGLSEPMLVKAIGEVINMSPELATTFARAGLRLAGPNATTFDMDHLYVHNAIEHDASISREDYSVNNDSHSFNARIFNESLSYFNEEQKISLPAAAAARWYVDARLIDITF